MIAIVSRKVSDTNFFFRPQNPAELSTVDLEGHRVAVDELSAQLSPDAAGRGIKSKFAPLSAAVLAGVTAGQAVEITLAT